METRRLREDANTTALLGCCDTAWQGPTRTGCTVTSSLVWVCWWRRRSVDAARLIAPICASGGRETAGPSPRGLVRRRPCA